MERAIEIGEAVAAANEKIAALGLGGEVCVLYSQGKSQVAGSSGRIYFEFADEEPLVACEVAYGHVEITLALLLWG